MDLKDYIRDVPDFPKPGIMFRDITPLLASPKAFGYVIDQFAERYQDAKVDKILAAEARGFIFAAPLALRLGASFVPVRKPGKLPFEKLKFEYDLEYGSDALEMHVDAVGEGDRVLLIDDLLATGGTMQACMKMAEGTGATVVGCGFLIELTFIPGREKLAPHEVCTLISYDSESE
ncbi:MAG: adenine phosphoribosyltransferase [Planctomycetaceae bacterium]